jgi:hypothetical protein
MTVYQRFQWNEQCVTWLSTSTKFDADQMQCHQVRNRDSNPRRYVATIASMRLRLTLGSGPVDSGCDRARSALCLAADTAEHGLP